MLRAALVMVLLFAVLSLLGARAEVGVLSGTLGSPAGALAGLAYAGAYFAALLLAPPLLVAGLYREAQSRLARRAARDTFTSAQ